MNLKETREFVKNNIEQVNLQWKIHNKHIESLIEESIEKWKDCTSCIINSDFIFRGRWYPLSEDLLHPSIHGMRTVVKLSDGQLMITINASDGPLKHFDIEKWMVL